MSIEVVNLGEAPAMCESGRPSEYGCSFGRGSSYQTLWPSLSEIANGDGGGDGFGKGMFMFRVSRGYGGGYADGSGDGAGCSEESL